MNAEMTTVKTVAMIVAVKVAARCVTGAMAMEARVTPACSPRV